MECCSTPMLKMVRPNKTVYYKCRICGHIEETNELEPDPSNSWFYGYEEEIDEHSPN